MRWIKGNSRRRDLDTGSGRRMTVYCLNCGTLRPYFPRIEGGVTCLLIETNHGLVLVDTGFGLMDYQQPTKSLDLFMALLRVPRDIDELASSQVKALGYLQKEVRHIVMTHLHLDHAGGLTEFPWAEVHLLQAEYEVVISGTGGWEYADCHWSHGPKWRPYSDPNGSWFGFEGVRMVGFQPEIWLIPLPGHSPGHSGVAVKTLDGWLLHASDALPFDLGYENLPNWLLSKALGPHGPRLRRLAADQKEVTLLSAHMSLAFYRNWIDLET